MKKTQCFSLFSLLVICLVSCGTQRVIFVGSSTIKEPGRQPNTQTGSTVLWESELSKNNRIGGELLLSADELNAQGRDREAIIDLSKIIELNPIDGRLLAFAYKARGICNFNIREYDSALDDFSRFIQLENEPDNAEGYFGRGRIYAIKNEYDKALSDLNKSIELDPTNAEAFYIRGSVYGLLEDYDKMLADLQETIRLNPQHRLALMGIQMLNNRPRR